MYDKIKIETYSNANVFKRKIYVNKLYKFIYLFVY